MEQLIIIIIMAVFFLLGRYDGKNSLKKHTVSITKPEYLPEDEVRKSFMTAIESKILFYDLAETKRGDGVVEKSITFYTERRQNENRN